VYTASFLAVRGDSGQLVWHYQTTPHDHWDFDSVQKLVMADVMIDGKPRQTIMQASRTAFLCVGSPVGRAASRPPITLCQLGFRVDLKTGKPVVTDEADWSRSRAHLSVLGRRTYLESDVLRLMTHLVYIPVLDVPTSGGHGGQRGSVKYIDGFFTVNGIMPDDSYAPADLRGMFGPLRIKHPSLACARTSWWARAHPAWDRWPAKNGVGARNVHGYAWATTVA